MRSAAVSDRKAAHPYRRQETASEVRGRPKCCSPYQERRAMKLWQSQPGGQAVGKRPAERALHGGFFSRPKGHKNDYRDAEAIAEATTDDALRGDQNAGADGQSVARHPGFEHLAQDTIMIAGRGGPGSPLATWAI